MALDTKLRRILTRLVIEKLTSIILEKIPSQIFTRIACQIAEYFPNDIFETYYIPAQKATSRNKSTNATGFLYRRYTNKKAN